MPSTNADNFSTTRVICTKREAGATLFGRHTVFDINGMKAQRIVALTPVLLSIWKV